MIEKRLLKEVVRNRTYFAKMLLHGVTSFVISFLIAWLVSETVTHLFLQQQALEQQGGLLTALAAVFLVRAVLTALFQAAFQADAEAVKDRLLLRATDGILRQGPISRGEASGARTAAIFEAAELIERYYAEFLPQLFTLMVSLPLILAAVFLRDWITGAIMLVTGPLLPFFMALVGAQSQKANEKRLGGLMRLSDGLMDFIGGAKTLKLFGATAAYRAQVAAQSEEFRALTMGVLRISFLSAFVLEFEATISTAIIAVSLGLRLMADGMQFRDAFFALLITPDFYLAIRRFGTQFHTAMGAKAAADVLFPYCGTVLESPDERPDTSRMPASEAAELRVEGASFSYPEVAAPALDGISLTARRGKVTALVGKSGSGKTTLVYALLGFLPLEHGRIFMGEAEISTCDTTQWRENIAFIPQKPYIFQDTLRNNLKIANQAATDAELVAALEQSALGAFLARLPDGLDTMLHEQGTSISTGEAQRLAFARACLKDSHLIVMDEATSALDGESETHIRTAFEALAQKKTVFIVAHRLETVQKADQIHVLEGGRVVQSGTHAALLAQEGAYRALVTVWEQEVGE